MAKDKIKLSSEGVVTNRDLVPEEHDEQLTQQQIAQRDTSWATFKVAEPGAHMDLNEVTALVWAFNGNYGKMAKAIGRPRVTVYNWVTGNMDLLSFRHDIIQSRLDNIEEDEFANAESGDRNSRQFLLTKQATERGYGIITKKPDEGGLIIDMKANPLKKMNAMDAGNAYSRMLGGK